MWGKDILLNHLKNNTHFLLLVLDETWEDEVNNDKDEDTCEEDKVPLLCVLCLEFDQTFQIRSLTRLNVTLVIREELH